MMDRKISETVFDVSLLSAIIVSIWLSFYVELAAVAGLAIGCYYSFFAKSEKVYGFLLALFPFAQIFKVHYTDTSLFTFIEIVFVARKILEATTAQKKIPGSMFFFFLYCLFIGIAVGNPGIINVIKVNMNLLITYFFIEDYQEDDLEWYVNFYCAGLLSSSVMGIFKKNIPGFFTRLGRTITTVWSYGRDSERFCGTFTDPNYYSIAVITGLALILCLLACKKKTKFYIILGAAILVFGALTYSKSFILMLFILGLVGVRLLSLHKKGWYIIGLAIAAAIGISIVLASDYGKVIMGRFDTSSSENFVEKMTTGRTRIWKDYLEYLVASPLRLLFGCGCGAGYYQGWATHNTYIEIIYYTGVFGELLYFINVWSIFRSRKLIEWKTINYYLIICILIMLFFLASFRNCEIPFYLISAWIVLNTDLFNTSQRSDVKQMAKNPPIQRSIKW